MRDSGFLSNIYCCFTFRDDITPGVLPALIYSHLIKKNIIIIMMITMMRMMMMMMTMPMMMMMIMMTKTMKMMTMMTRNKWEEKQERIENCIYRDNYFTEIYDAVYARPFSLQRHICLHFIVFVFVAAAFIVDNHFWRSCCFSSCYFWAAFYFYLLFLFILFV